MTDAIEKLIERVPERSPEEIERARRAVAAAAIDEDDCRELLAMLGLLPPSGERRRVGFHASGIPKWAEG